jgi:uroporphyrinogen-III synthase
MNDVRYRGEGALPGLSGKTVAVPEGRQLAKFVRMLKDQGADTVEVPLVRIEDVSDPVPIEVWLDRMIAGLFDDFILLTGEGLVRLLGFAERGGRREGFIAALKSMRTITRGPKPAAALHALGLHPGLAAKVPTADGVRESLSREHLAGRQIAVQLYGQETLPALIEFLERQGGVVSTVAPYTYVDGIEDAVGVSFVKKLTRGEIDAIAFTSGIQIKTLFDWAARHGLSDELATGLRRTAVASVGPACTATLAQYGVDVEIAPSRSFFMRPLVEALSSGLTEAQSSSEKRPSSSFVLPVEHGSASK